MRAVLFRLLAVAAALVLAGAVAEVALRLAPASAQPPDLVVRHKRRPKDRLRPALRLPAPPTAKEPGTFRVVVVGDSFAWGGGVYADDAFPARIERIVARRAPELAFEVVNWSRPGWNTTSQLAAYGRSARELDPDLVILQFALNDPEPDDRKELARLRRGFTRRDPGAGLSAVLFEASALYRRLWNSYENVRLKYRLRRYYRDLFADGEPGWQACVEALRGFHRLTFNRGVRLLLVVFPVFDSSIDADYGYRDLHAKTAAAAEALGVRVLDLLPAYEGLDGRRLAVEPYTDPHPNELAHRIAADAILDELARRRWLPEPARRKVEM